MGKRKNIRVEGFIGNPKPQSLRVVSTALRERLLFRDDLPPSPQEAGYGTLEMFTKNMPSNSYQPVDDKEVRQMDAVLR